MAQLTKEQLDFLKSQGVPLSKVFDATGMGPSKYSTVMKDLGMVVAYGVTPCGKAGHRLKTRSGHCVQCKTANLAFQARFDDPGEVYVARSAKQNILKVGTSSTRPTPFWTLSASLVPTTKMDLRSSAGNSSSATCRRRLQRSSRQQHGC